MDTLFIFPVIARRTLVRRGNLMIIVKRLNQAALLFYYFLKFDIGIFAK